MKGINFFKNGFLELFKKGNSNLSLSKANIMIILFGTFFTFSSFGQQMVTIQPTGAKPEDEVKVIFDANAGNGELKGATKVYMHAGVVTSNPMGTAWEHVVGNWGADDGVGAMTKVAGETNKWEIILSPSVKQYFKVDAGKNVFRLAMVFRNANGSTKATISPGTYDWGMVASNGDILVDLNTGPYVNILAPATNEVFVEVGQLFLIKARASADVTSMAILVNEGGTFVEKNKVTSGNEIEHYWSPSSSGTYTIKVTATIGGVEVESTKTIKVTVRGTGQVAELPAGVKKGINYHADATKVTLVLEAPGKDFVYVVGDFTNWEVKDEYLMNKTADGKFFWLEITGLTSGKEYIFQYWVDGTIKIGDPYAEKVADPWNDQYISSQTYPGLISYNKTEHGIASVLQTAQEEYDWAETEALWTKPPQENLIIYEVLLRDFLASHSYRDLTDTLSYLKRLGVNAIQLMPIMEFEGNISWGYNPSYFFAPDKYYGSKNDLKKFIETAHKEGFAVILDMVLNHAFGQNPMVRMYWDPANNTVSSTSPWFNPQATHPFNVGFDFNHESEYTKKFVDSVNTYWLEEYHFDGFRFDLSKGFTQKNNANDVGAWSAYDASRIAILKRMADKIWTHSPDAYVILEHFADNAEEKELAEYRAAEGKGMMLWGNLNHAYNQNTMGYAEDSDIRWVYHGTRNWAAPHVVGYMESHDEERLVYRNKQFGNISGSYSVKNPATAIERIKPAVLLFYTIPGPKMLWQFGELGYDYSINHCENGTVSDNCRLSPKPITWQYYNDPVRKSLFDFTADLLRLRKEYNVFTTGTATLDAGNTLVKQATILNKASTSTPTSADQMNVKIVVNMDVTAKNIAASFPHTGKWYDYYKDGEEINVTSSTYNVLLMPGQYKLYSDYPIKEVVSGIIKLKDATITLYPNPTEQVLKIHSTRQKKIETVLFRNMEGKEVYPLRSAADQWNLSDLPLGFYIVSLKIDGAFYHTKILKR